MRPEHREWLLDDEVDTDPRFPREISLAKNGLVQGVTYVTDTADEIAELRQPRKIVVRLVPVKNVQGDNQFFQGRVAGPLAEPVGAAMNHLRSGFHARKLG